MIFFPAWLIVLMFSAGLLHLIGQPQQPQQPQPPKEFLKNKSQGFVFGKHRHLWREPQYFCKDEQTDGHILIVGGAGSGKSSGLAIPSLRSWQQRIFAIDIKGELAAATAHKPGQRKVFNPMQPDSYGYDPFYLLSHSDNPAQSAKEIAAAIIPKPANVKDPFWIQAAQNLLTGFVLHYQAAGSSFVDTITVILRRPVDLHVKYLLETSLCSAAILHLNQFASMDSKTLSGIFAELSNHIMLFATDEHIKAALAQKNTFGPDDLENGIDVFLSIPEDKSDQWQSLVTLITNQFLKHFERRADNNATPILFLLDEFPRLGKIEAIATALTTLRSKKITIALIIQSLAQLDYLYGPALRRVILDNCSYQAILGATDADTQEYFSRLVGTREATRQGESSSYEPDSGEQRGYTVSQHIIDRRIIQPHEFATLREVVLLSPWGCYGAEKIKS